MNGTINSSAQTAIGAELEKGNEEEELNVPLLLKHNSCFPVLLLSLLVALVQSAVP
jgi:hypothetical protein